MFHLRTRVIDLEDNVLMFTGAGPLASASISYDYILDFRPSHEKEPAWYGAVYRTEDAPESNYSGIRSDGTTEIWSLNKDDRNFDCIQEMTWVGKRPSSYITSEIRTGIDHAQELVDTIIHPIGR